MQKGTHDGHSHHNTKTDTYGHLAVTDTTVKRGQGLNMQLHPLIEEWVLWQLSARRSLKTVTERSRVIQQFITETGANPITATADIAYSG